MEYPMIHLCYRVRDLAASEEFYRKAFGFEVSRKEDFPAARFTLCYMTSAGLPFELEPTYNYDQTEPYQLGNGYSHLAVAVANLEISHKHHAEMGLTVTPTKGLYPDQPTFYFVTDPDGYKIEVVLRNNL